MEMEAKDLESSEEKGNSREESTRTATVIDTQYSDEAKVNIVTDLDVYDGETLEEQIDSFIDEHPVVMFSRSWCLFSADAQDFLVLQLGVSVFSIEVDVHPQGKQIMKCVIQKTNCDQTPAIFVKGEFLGGFDEVNRLYSLGTLEKEYLSGLTHADRCEEFIINAKLQTKPLFWFPEKVDAYAIRTTGALTSLFSVTSVILVQWQHLLLGRYLAYGIFLDFCLRLLAGSRFSLFGRFASLIVYGLEPKMRSGRPKQFATMCGVMFSFFGSLFYIIKFPYHDVVGSVFIGILAFASGMEGFLDFCLGCVFFRLGIGMGIIPK